MTILISLANQYVGKFKINFCQYCHPKYVGNEEYLSGHGHYNKVVLNLIKS